MSEPPHSVEEEPPAEVLGIHAAIECGGVKSEEGRIVERDGNAGTVRLSADHGVRVREREAVLVGEVTGIFVHATSAEFNGALEGELVCSVSHL